MPLSLSNGPGTFRLFVSNLVSILVSIADSIFLLAIRKLEGGTYVITFDDLTRTVFHLLEQSSSSSCLVLVEMERKSSEASLSKTSTVPYLG